MKKSIMYVDDEQINLLLFKISFENDFDLHIASGGHEALDILEKNDISIVFSDFRMPIMDGGQLISKIKELNNNIRCFLLTAYNKEEVVKFINDDNTDNIEKIISKPWLKKDLLKIIDK